MVENLISVGDKIELKQIINRIQSEDTEYEVRVYKSQILDIYEDDFIQAAMPIYEGHLVPLEIGSKYDTFFQTSKGLFRTICEVTGRSKEEKIYIVQLKIKSELIKFQRREYFRLNINLSVRIAVFSETELKSYQLNKQFPEKFENEITEGSIIDISGGGVKVVSKETFNKNAMLVLEFEMIEEATVQTIKVLGKVVAIENVMNRADLHEYRIQFKWISNTTREIIVKVIFEEQKRLRQKERGW